MNTQTGAITLLDAKTVVEPFTVPEGHVLIQGTQEDVAIVASTVSAKYRAERKAKNKAAKKSRRANR